MFLLSHLIYARFNPYFIFDDWSMVVDNRILLLFGISPLTYSKDNIILPTTQMFDNGCNRKQILSNCQL